MKYSKEVKTGALALAAILILIFGYNYLKGKNLLDPSRTFYAVYSDVEGLSQSSPVTINGLKVGQVTRIDFLNESGLLVVEFTVDKGFKFSKNSLAQIYGGGLIGGKSLAIVPEYESDLIAKSGDTLPSAVEEGIMELVNERLTPLQVKVERTVVSADSLLTAFNQVFTPETREKLRIAFEDLSVTMASFKGTASDLNEIVMENSDNIDTTFKNLSEMSTNFSRFSDSLSKVDIAAMSRDMEKVVMDFQGISKDLQEGKGTAGKLLNDETVYNNLERATRNMEQLLQDIKLNPKRYVHFSVFGKNPEPYQLEKDSL